MARPWSLADELRFFRSIGVPVRYVGADGSVHFKGGCAMPADPVGLPWAVWASVFKDRDAYMAAQRLEGLRYRARDGCETSAAEARERMAAHV